MEGIGPGIDNVLSMTVYGRDGSPQPSAAYYYLKDHQNTVIALTDSSGTVVESYDYDAYGHVTVFDSRGNALTSDLGLPTSGVGNRYTFQGREIDWDTGLIYFRARWYNPETGRWLSKDPIGIAGGVNLYAFCGNNPVMFVDPDGQNYVGIPGTFLPGAHPPGSPPLTGDGRPDGAHFDIEVTYGPHGELFDPDFTGPSITTTTEIDIEDGSVTKKTSKKAFCFNLKCIFCVEVNIEEEECP